MKLSGVRLSVRLSLCLSVCLSVCPIIIRLPAGLLLSSMSAGDISPQPALSRPVRSGKCGQWHVVSRRTMLN